MRGDVRSFPLFEAIEGRRSRRFGLGMEIPGGPFAFRSRHPPLSLRDDEEELLLAAVCGQTGWLFLHPYSPQGRPEMPAYAASAVGRTFPSSGGFHTTEVFFTNDDGTFFVSTRDALPSGSTSGLVGLARRVFDHRLVVPEDPYIAPHNRWCANKPGTTLVMPVADVAQQLIALISATLQRGIGVYDDMNRSPLVERDHHRDVLYADVAVPLSVIEQEALWSCATEIAVACYAGSLALQALGLGSWMFGGIDALAVLGVARGQANGGLGFEAVDRPDWPSPNPTGLRGVFEAFCPPHVESMAAAVDRFSLRRFGPAGPFNPDTPGPWPSAPRVRGSVGADSAPFSTALTAICEAIYTRFGRFPATVPSVLMTTYLQAHHLELDYYDRHFEPGAYLESHRRHMADWHQEA